MGQEIIIRGLGMNDAVGHMDFYPNGGQLQLGCVHTSQSGSGAAGAMTNITAFFIFNGCDHERANEFFMESVNHESAFRSVLCDSYSDYENGKCDGSSVTAEMGFHAKKSLD
ncbi:lipase domain-containing protein [Caerostris extrusa]|uniref:Lipase domain-containing protein n=1 Tax=Caerostris extrusa TaxID=172846 RepID=A0AAV4TXL3_CAEEX|nr:lipase domain-containing protein [Caerostris extrusa]